MAAQCGFVVAKAPSTISSLRRSIVWDLLRWLRNHAPSPTAWKKKNLVDWIYLWQKLLCKIMHHLWSMTVSIAASLETQSFSQYFEPLASFSLVMSSVKCTYISPRLSILVVCLCISVPLPFSLSLYTPMTTHETNHLSFARTEKWSSSAKGIAWKDATWDDGLSACWTSWWSWSGRKLRWDRYVCNILRMQALFFTPIFQCAPQISVSDKVAY